MKAHPLADRFPMLPDDELDRLAEDIRENGLRNPITLDAEGLILDGRNRYAACERAGVTPETVVYDGEDVAAFVLSANVARRHQSTGSRAMSTALVLADAGKRQGGRWERDALSGTGDTGRTSDTEWARAMSKAGVVLDHAPDLAEQVVDGTLALDAAHRQAEQRRDAERQVLAEEERIAAEEADARTRLEHTAPDYLDRHPTARQAWSAWEDDNRREAARIRQEKAAQEKRAAEERRARSDLYTGIATALGTVGTYGGYDDIPALMTEYDPAELNPPQAARYLTLDNLTAARRFVDGLIAWKESQ